VNEWVWWLVKVNLGDLDVQYLKMMLLMYNQIDVRGVRQRGHLRKTWWDGDKENMRSFGLSGKASQVRKYPVAVDQSANIGLPGRLLLRWDALTLRSFTMIATAICSNLSKLTLIYLSISWHQCFDTVGWESGSVSDRLMIHICNDTFIVWDHNLWQL